MTTTACPSCGAEVRPEARFCMECGNALGDQTAMAAIADPTRSMATQVAPTPPTSAWEQPSQWGSGPPQSSTPTAVAAAAPGHARPAGRTSTVAGALLLLSATVLAIGTFMDWVEAEIGDEVLTGTGWETIAGNLGDGPVLLGLAAIVAGLGGVVLSGVRRKTLKVSAVVAAVAALGVAIYELIDVATPGEGVEASAQIGLWLVLASAGTALVGALLAPAA